MKRPSPPRRGQANQRRGLAFLLSAGLLLFAAPLGAESGTLAPVADPAPPVVGPYRGQVTDVLNAGSFRTLLTQTATVRSDGAITPGLLGNVQAARPRPTEDAGLLKPQITVNVIVRDVNPLIHQYVTAKVPIPLFLASDIPGHSVPAVRPQGSQGNARGA